MWGIGRQSEAAKQREIVLDLSGPKLRGVFERLVEDADATGGIERYVAALALKASLFDKLFAEGRAAQLDEGEFCDLCAFIAPARRRVGAWLATNGFPELRRRIERLLAGTAASADQSLADFVAGFPADRTHRWMRDLGAEILHFTAPEDYPLTTRWMWDARAGTGVLREIWFADDPDRAVITASDALATFRVLGEELSGFLHDNGVFRDLPFYVDLLCAHVYAFYINDRGATYLKKDFGGNEDPMAHTRRLLGLDAVDTKTGRTRLKLIDGTAHHLGAQRLVER
jgi:hypothetical protein